MFWLSLWKVLIDIALEDYQDWLRRKVVLQCEIQIIYAGIQKVNGEVNGAWQGKHCVL